MSKTVDTMATPLRTRGLTVSSVIKEGDPKHVLLDEAEHWGADCIFVGARGLSRVERFLLGSVAAAINKVTTEMQQKLKAGALFS